VNKTHLKQSFLRLAMGKISEEMEQDGFLNACGEEVLKFSRGLLMEVCKDVIYLPCFFRMSLSYITLEITTLVCLPGF